MADSTYTQQLTLPEEGDSLRQLTEAFARATGMEITVWNESEQPCGYSAMNDSQFCSLLHGCGKGGDLCVCSDREAFRRSRETDGVYCYRCPFGLIEAVVPIRRGEKHCGFVMAGKVAGEGEDSTRQIRDRLLALYPEIRGYFDPDAALAEIPRVSAEKLADNLRLLAALAEVFAERGVTSAPVQSLAKSVRQFLDGHFDRRVTLPELSVRFHCSTVTLNTHFRRAFGITVLQYLNRRRMTHAEELLRKTDLSLAEISDLCGFSDADYFSRVFRGQHGMSPNAFRLAAR